MNDKTHRNRREEKKRKVVRNFLFLIIGLGVLFLIGMGSYYFAKNRMSVPQKQTEQSELNGENVEITVPAGATTADISELLKKKGLIKSTLKFRLDSRLNDYDGTYRQGTYAVDISMTPIQMMQLFQTGVVIDDRLKLVVPEGFTIADIGARLEEKEIVTAEEFIAEVNTGQFDYDFLTDIPKRENRLEGYLFPDTYYLKDDITAHEIVEKMLTRFDEIYTKEYQKTVEKSPFTLDQLVTIASIVEAEIRVPEERKRAAGVIYNRLKENMPLQMDATVLYAMGMTKENVMEKDLQVDSPYNTYKHKGLPVGPVSNPGVAALEAALYPEDNQYLYYVLEARGMSNHIYTETYEEFLTAKEKYKASK